MNRNLYVVTSVALLAPLTMGYTLGYTSPGIPDLESRGLLNSSQASWFGSVIAIGAMFGGAIAGALVDRVGRKLTILLCALPYVLGYLSIALSHGIFAWLIIGRVLTGIACGMTSLVVPVYIAETSTASLRGMLGAGFQVAVTVGILFAYLMGLAKLSYIWLALVAMTLPTAMVILFVTMPETPRYLLSKNRRNEAIRTVAWFRGPHVNAEEECCEIESNLDQQETMAWSEFLKPALYKPLAISLLLMVFQQFSGINAVMFYTVDIFNGAGFENGIIATVIVGCVQVVFTCVCSLLMDRAGRRLLLIIAGLGMTVSSVTFGLYYELSEHTHNSTTVTSSVSSEHLSWLSLCSMIIYIIAFSLGWGAIPWLIMSEIFPPRARGTASGIATYVNWTCAFIVTLTFNDMMHTFTRQGTFWFFGSVCFVAVLFVFKCVPETKGRTLEEIVARFESTSPKNM